MWTIRKATKEDVISIAPRLRDADQDEIMYAAGDYPKYVLERALDLPGLGSWVGCWNGQPEAIFGVAHGPMGIGIPWLVATDVIAEKPKYFVKMCRPWLDGWSMQYSQLTSFVHAKNELHIRWLKWCGFKFVALHPEYGAHKEPFWEINLIQGEADV